MRTTFFVMFVLLPPGYLLYWAWFIIEICFIEGIMLRVTLELFVDSDKFCVDASEWYSFYTQLPYPFLLTRPILIGGSHPPVSRFAPIGVLYKFKSEFSSVKSGFEISWLSKLKIRFPEATLSWGSSTKRFRLEGFSIVSVPSSISWVSAPCGSFGTLSAALAPSRNASFKVVLGSIFLRILKIFDDLVYLLYAILLLQSCYDDRIVQINWLI